MNEVEINKQAKLSEHFSLGELSKTKHVTADKNIRCEGLVMGSGTWVWVPVPQR